MIKYAQCYHFLPFCSDMEKKICHLFIHRRRVSLILHCTRWLFFGTFLWCVFTLFQRFSFIGFIRIFPSDAYQLDVSLSTLFCGLYGTSGIVSSFAMKHLVTMHVWNFFGIILPSGSKELLVTLSLPFQILLDARVTSTLQPSRLPLIPITWCPPPVENNKINTDGSFSYEHSHGGIRCIFLDDQRNPLLHFAKLLNVDSTIKFEIITLERTS